MLQEKVEITKNTKLNEQFAHLAFKCKIASELKCGQFVYVRLTDSVEPLLRRPFSVAWIDKDEINIVYKIIGKGTNLLSGKRVGEQLDVMGPLGKGFSFHSDKEVVLVAGGIGIASLVSLTRMCKQNGMKLFYGARNESEFISQHFLDLEPNEIEYVTEDGSRGHKGYVTGALDLYLQGHNTKNIFMYTCGPLPMLEAVVKMANKYGIDGEANLEERMGCGVGACLGCATQTASGVKMVCKDGPVFSFKELGWAY